MTLRQEDAEQIFKSMISSEKMLKELVDGKTFSAERLVRLDLTVGTLQKEVAEILTLVRGRDGFEVKVTLLEDRVQRIEQTSAEGTRGRWLAASSAIAGLFSIVAMAISLFGKK